ncbi:MAG TPA: flagellar FliJ family protein [Verrucomicrobiae bacterium]|jgi:flagellar export protein FliJ
MKAFQFSLEAVQVVRQRQENDALESYAGALLARQQAIDLVEGIEQRLREHYGQILQMVAGGCAASQAAQAQNYHRSLTQRRDEAAAALRKADGRVSSACDAMMAARQQREIVDGYRRKQQAAHHRTALREEQKMLDEFAIRRATVLTASQTHADT